MRAHGRDLTPTWRMGAVAECFRKQRGVLRSSHPSLSFGAWGRQAATVIQGHTLDYGLGAGSSVAGLYDLVGWVLLLGVGHGGNSSLHLAEYRASYSGKRGTKDGAPVLVEGHRRWAVRDIEPDASDFKAIGEQFAGETGVVRAGHVACAKAQLMPLGPLVDYAGEWMRTNRSGCGGSKRIAALSAGSRRPLKCSRHRR